MRKKILLILLVIFLGISFAQAEPLETIKNSVNKVLDILKDPLYQESAKKELQREKISAEIRDIFDFSEMTKRSLAKHWKKFTPKQQAEFRELFSELLEKIYIKKIQGYTNEEILYFGENITTDLRATVKTKIVTEGSEIPIDYRMIMKQDGWKVYDFSIEGVSLIKNYRAQFQKILMKESPEALIKTLKKKVRE